MSLSELEDECSDSRELVEAIESPQVGEKWPRLRTLLPRVVIKSQNDTDTSNQDDGAPRDRFHLVYLAMVVAGMGFLTPFNTYTGAIDYFFYYYEEQFPSVSVIIPICYFVTTVLFSTLNLFLVKVVAIHNRIAFGYVMFIVSLLMIPLLDIGIHNCSIPTGVSFYLTILSVSLVGLGSGVQQSSYYGLSSMLPRRYTQAVMAGESASGVIQSGFRIVTKAAVKSERVGALIFFSLSLCFIALCICCHVYIRRSKIVIFYTRRCHPDHASSTSDAGRENVDEQLLLKHSDSVEMEEIAPSSQCTDAEVSTANESANRSRVLTGTKDRTVSLRSLLRVVAQIWPLMAAIFSAYFVTLLLFPGLISEVQNCSLGSWTPILLVAIFNLVDFVAKCLTLLPLKWSPKQLLIGSTSRLVLIPLIVMCVSPSPSNPVFGRGVVVWAAGIFTLILALSNGYFGSLPLISLSAHVKNKRDRELAGVTMTWVLLIGLLLGAVCAYALTPLTTIQERQFCHRNDSNTFFDLCDRYGNNTS